jgi:hypothetical protein
MSYFPPYLRVATISLLNLPTLLFRWTRGVESRFLAWSWRWLLGRSLHRSTSWTHVWRLCFHFLRMGYDMRACIRSACCYCCWCRSLCCWWWPSPTLFISSSLDEVTTRLKPRKIEAPHRSIGGSVGCDRRIERRGWILGVDCADGLRKRRQYFSLFFLPGRPRREVAGSIEAFGTSRDGARNQIWEGKNKF